MRIRVPSIFWTATATVYTKAASGRWTVLARANLVCRLAILGVQQSGIDPQTGQPLKRFYWQDTTYALPHDCQLLVGGVRYNPVHGSEKSPAPLGTVLYKAVDVIRAE